MEYLKLNSRLFEKIVELIKNQCCNFCDNNCLLLDDGDYHTCPQLITPSHIICKYFFDCVLPGDKALMKSIIDFKSQAKSIFV